MTSLFVPTRITPNAEAMPDLRQGRDNADLTLNVLTTANAKRASENNLLRLRSKEFVVLLDKARKLLFRVLCLTLQTRNVLLSLPEPLL